MVRRCTWAWSFISRYYGQSGSPHQRIPDKQDALLRLVLSVVTISLSVVLLTSAFALFFREFSYYKIRNAFSIILQLTFIASCLLLLVLVLFGNDVIDYENNRHLGWFVMSAVLVLALALAGLRLPS